jgi:hypothetical protein
MASAQGSALGPFLLRADHLVFEGDAFGIVLLERFYRDVGIREHLDVLGVANLLAGVDVDQHGHWSLLSFRLPQWVSLRSGLNTRST